MLGRPVAQCMTAQGQRVRALVREAGKGRQRSESPAGHADDAHALSFHRQPAAEDP